MLWCTTPSSEGLFQEGSMDTWQIVETTFDPQQRAYKEAVFTIGNGYLGTRGAFEEGYDRDQPVTLVHGVFDDVPIVHTELANAPSWTGLSLRIGDDWFRMDRGTVLSYERRLDLKTGTLKRDVRWRAPGGRVVSLSFERFASMADPHVMVVRCHVRSETFSGQVEVRAGVDGIVDNEGHRHWGLQSQGQVGDRAVMLAVETRESGIVLAEAAHLTLSAAGAVAYEVRDCPWSPHVLARCRLRPGGEVTIDKIVTVYTSRDVVEPARVAVDTLLQAVSRTVPALRRVHEQAWAALWQASDIEIDGDPFAEQAVRFSLYQLLIAAPQDDDRVSIPAKTLSGYGYRGHVFWDVEIFMLPFFIYTQPARARDMLLYRYHTLPGARRKAVSQGYRGAMYAWESAATGDETTPRWVPVWVEERGEDELIRIWCGDIELHITADIAHAVHTYWRVTGDDAFMRDYGAEIILETASFWASRAEWNEAQGWYEIADVIGPDENHDHIDNSAFTNEMARWNLQTAMDVLAWLRVSYPSKAAELVSRLALTSEWLRAWEGVIDGLKRMYDPETKLIEQFDGFYDLETLDFSAYEPRQTSLQAILGIEETQQVQVLKQPDVLMLLYLLGERFDEETLAANWAYYTPRTDLTYGSSLGPAIQAALAARMGELDQAYRYFRLAAQTDLEDARGNTADGLHGATAGGLWQAVVFGFAGVRLTDAGFEAEPRLPPTWGRLAFKLQYHGKWRKFELSQPPSD
ncbi:MAG: glycoside hydrolase family 65 protein [Anaerolineae bacterium]|nr:glycoside hydrolase family 65 protein [Anaerolineae bacterium]